jgi:hypothetical protein
MKTITNTTGSKAVKITNPSPMTFVATYVQIYQGEEDVIELKTFKTLKGAEKWANSLLNTNLHPIFQQALKPFMP